MDLVAKETTWHVTADEKPPVHVIGIGLWEHHHKQNIDCNGERNMPQIGKTERIHVDLCDLLPYWKKFLTELHARGILYSYATEKEKLMVLNKVKK